MRGLSFIKCADALLDTKVRPNAVGTQKFYDKAVEYIERSNNMNKPETGKDGYAEWLEFCSVIQIRWKNALEGSLPKSNCDHAYACTLLSEVLGKSPSNRSERLRALSVQVDADVFLSSTTTASEDFGTLNGEAASEYLRLYHTALENAKGRRATLLAVQDVSAERDAITE